jgi:hypothetical protein
VRLGTFVGVFSASPFATRTAGKSTMARAVAQARRSDRKSPNILVIVGGKSPNPILSNTRFGTPVLYGTARRNHAMTESCQFRIVLLVSRNLLGALS